MSRDKTQKKLRDLKTAMYKRIGGGKKQGRHIPRKSLRET